MTKPNNQEYPRNAYGRTLKAIQTYKQLCEISYSEIANRERDLTAAKNKHDALLQTMNLLEAIRDAEPCEQGKRDPQGELYVHEDMQEFRSARMSCSKPNISNGPITFDLAEALKQKPAKQSPPDTNSELGIALTAEDDLAIAAAMADRCHCPEDRSCPRCHAVIRWSRAVNADVRRIGGWQCIPCKVIFWKEGGHTVGRQVGQAWNKVIKLSM